MIQMNGAKIKFNYMGYFTSDETWTHPTIKESTYEIIYVTEGIVYLYEGDKKYELKKGDLIVLKPHTIHGGYKHSVGRTEFYWTHFNLYGYSSDTIFLSNFTYASLFKELLHYSSTPHCPGYVKDSILSHILTEISQAEEKKNMSHLACKILEWTRINAGNDVTVSKIAEHFGYNSEHISRLMKKEYGMSLKQIIDDFIIRKAQNYLCNTTFSVKEISNILGFTSANAFINFYKYHENQSPNKFRNSYSSVHMNKK